MLAVDATGVKVHNRGEWMGELYGPKMRRKRGYLKLHLSVDIKGRKIGSKSLWGQGIRHESQLQLLGLEKDRCRD
ncbi:MAG: hypothetical protein QW756_04475 [Nitrososphaerota archaeon]